MAVEMAVEGKVRLINARVLLLTVRVHRHRDGGAAEPQTRGDGQEGHGGVHQDHAHSRRGAQALRPPF